jgi:hypothetical protein|tara:strand:- start:393 stop:695 length:303 start_codon:yes stop_codon:yes gene_type:complete
MTAQKPVGKTTIKSRIEHYCALVMARTSWGQVKKKALKRNEAQARKVSRGLSLTKAQIKKAQALAADGWTNERLHKHFRVGRGQIAKHCKGIKRGHPDGR